MSTGCRRAGRTRRHLLAACVLTGALCSWLTACADPQQEPGSGATGAFDGPWAEELAYYDAATSSSFAHEAFADSVITEAEAQEGRGLIAACYADHGAEADYDVYGRVTVSVVSGSEDPLDVMGTCEFADGGVTVLAGMMRLNPDHLDDFTIQAACLVEQGVVETGFTAHDLQQAYDTNELPWQPSDQDVVTTCMIDPLGLAAQDPA
jgi:hypothetical protein